MHEIPQHKILYVFCGVQDSCMEFERLVAAQCEALIQAINDRREYLLDAIRRDKDTKIRILKVSVHTFQAVNAATN